MREVGYKVQIFSSHPGVAQKTFDMIRKVMEKQGVYFELLVKYKVNLITGKKAYIVFDDNHSTDKVDAQHQYAPDDHRIAKS